MEKMNQVSVSEFFAKSKEELYDMAVEMVEKYNRLIDICNDSAERMADLIERHVKKVDELEKEVNKWQDLAKMNRDTICDQYNVCEDFKKKIAELEEKVKHQKENLDGINKTLEIRTKENERLIAVKNNQAREIEAHESENKRLTEKIIELKKTIEKCKDYDTSLMDSLRINNDDLKEQVSKLKKELNESYRAWNIDSKNHSKRDMVIVDEIAKKNDEIEKFKVDLIHEREKNEKLAKDHAELENDMRYKTIIEYQDVIDGLNKEIDYYKNQERIRTDQLRATESKVEELYKHIENIEHLKKKEDDHGKSGFKRYIEHLIEEEERAVPERFKARLNKEITEIFTKEEETEVKGVGRTSSGRYPWGAKVNDIPCGEDSIE